MSTLKQKIAFIFIILLTVICYLPSIFLNQVERIDTFYHLDILFAGFATLFFIVSWYGYFPRFIAALMGVLAFLALVTVTLMFSYHFFLNSNVISLVFETMSQISWMYLRSLPIFFYIVIIVLIAITVFCMKYPLKLTPKVRSKWVLFSTALFTLAAFHIGIGDEPQESRMAIQGNEYLSYDGYIRNEALRNIFPVFIPYIIKDYYHQRTEILHMAESFKDFQFNIDDKKDYSQRQVFIYVLGEASRADHWSLNGYERQTTPQLAARDDLINFPHMYVLQSVTRYALPVMISRKPIDLYQDYYHEPSIITYFKNLGFETAWISLPQEFGQGESAIAVYAYEANHQFFINPAGFNNKTKPDTASIEYVERLIQNSDKNLFIVIHTLGSHQRFYDRYEDDMRVFVPDRFADRDANIYSKDDLEVFINSYDNTILATDDFLNKLITYLEGQDLSSFVFYVSDHGEGLFDDGGIVLGHGTQTFATLNTASVFWASPKFRQENKVLLDNMAYNAQNLTTIDMMFETLVSLSGGKLVDSNAHLDMTQRDLIPPDAVVNVLREKEIFDYQPTMVQH